MAAAVLAFLFGASIGSFVNLVADRLPLGQSIVRPSSRCPGCGRHLSALELVPVLSYLVLRGRCYQCRSRIPLRVLAVEVVLGLVAVYLSQVSTSSSASLVLFAYVALLVLMAIIDLEHGVILNILVYPGLAVSVLLSPWWGLLGLERSFLRAEDPWRLLLGSLAGGAISAGFFTVPILVYPRGMGWGDVKMAGLIGLATGLPGALVGLLVAIASGGVVAVVLLSLRLRSRQQSIPFGPFLALGGSLALLFGDPLWRWYRSLW